MEPDANDPPGGRHSVEPDANDPPGGRHSVEPDANGVTQSPLLRPPIPTKTVLHTPPMRHPPEGHFPIVRNEGSAFVIT